MLARDRLKVGGIAIEKPFQPFLDVQDVWDAHNKMPAGPEQALELSNSLMRIFYVLESFNTDNVVETLLFVRKRSCQVTAPDFHILQTKDLWIEVAALHFKAEAL